MSEALVSIQCVGYFSLYVEATLSLQGRVAWWALNTSLIAYYPVFSLFARLEVKAKIYRFLGWRYAQR